MVLSHNVLHMLYTTHIGEGEILDLIGMRES